MAISSISYKPVVLPSQKSSTSRINVKIRVTFKRASRYIPTQLFVTQRDLTSKGELKGSALINANRIIDQFYRYTSDLDFFAMQKMEIDNIIEYISMRVQGDKVWRLDFFEYAEEYIATKKPSTAQNYRQALNAFKVYLGVPRIDINDITYPQLYAFGQWLEAGGIRRSDKHFTTIRGMYLRKLSTIYSAAKLKYNDDDREIYHIPRNPFARLDMSVPYVPARTAKSIEFIQDIISFNEPCTRTMRIALDVYIISFALMGMNAADIISAPAPRNNIVTYNRQKTRDVRIDRAEHKVYIDERVRPLLKKYADPEGIHLTNFSTTHCHNKSLSAVVRQGCYMYAKLKGVEGFSLYSARHSWATIARSSSCNIDKSTVNECLVHTDSDLKIADVYIERDWKVLWAANKKVLDLFDWSNIKNICKW